MEARYSVKLHKLWIEITSYDPNLIITDPDQLIVLESGPQTSNVFTDFVLESKQFDYKIIFNPEQIEDYLDVNNDTVTITFQLKFQFKQTSQEQIIEEFSMDIKFLTSSPKPQGKIKLEPDFITGFEHTRQKNLLFGYFSLFYPSNYNFISHLNCDLKIVCMNKNDELVDEEWSEKKTLFWGDINDIQESNSSNQKKGFLKEEDEDKTFSFMIQSLEKNAYRIENLGPNNEVKIPMCIDLDHLPNPKDSTEYKALVSVGYSVNNKKEWDSLSSPFIIKKDTRTTKLEIELIDGINEKECINGEKLEISPHLQWLKGKPGDYLCFTFKLSNRAVSGNGAVYIHNLSITFRYLKDNQFITCVKNKKFGFFRFMNKNDKKINKDYVFYNDNDSFEKITVSFRHDLIKDMSYDIIPLACNVCFYYLEEKERFNSDLDLASALATRGIPYSHDFCFSIEKNLGPYWLAVDFGTSAIVAAFDKDADININFIDLQKTLHKRVESMIGPSYYNSEQVMEFGTRFLPSTIVLQNNNVFNAKSCRDDIVLLSPIQEEIDQNINYMIPYLKSLIGADILPPFNEFFYDFNYYDNIESKKKTQQQRTLRNDPLKVSSILINAYKFLFREYIPQEKEIQKQNEIVKMNKVILTVPNVFTPRHIDSIKSLIRKKTSYYDFKDDYIRFISESDAVACYYMINRDRLNSNRDRSERDKLFSSKEYVLVYDMGAGTLDLSYICISRKDNNFTEIEILGRIGNHIAGNYLDFSIASAINDKNPFNKNEKIFGTTPRSFNMQRTLKKIIRDSIKPRLSDEKKFILESNLFEPGILDNNVELDLEAIRENKHIKKFVRKNSRDIIKAFFKLFNRIENKTRIKGGYPLDTVLFTGRSVMFKPIRNAIKKELEEWSSNNNIFYIEDLNAVELKSIVVNGALQFALMYRNQNESNVKFVNKNLQARYGFVYRNPESPGKWKFKELLNPNTPPIKKTERDGMIINNYDTNIFDTDPQNNNKPNYINLSATKSFYFVQSYSDDTENDVINDNYDFITKMIEFHREEIGQTEAEVRVTINDNNEMIVQAGRRRNDPTEPLRIDISSSNRQFVESMWPYFQQSK